MFSPAPSSASRVEGAQTPPQSEDGEVEGDDDSHAPIRTPSKAEIDSMRAVRATDVFLNSVSERLVAWFSDGQI